MTLAESTLSKCGLWLALVLGTACSKETPPAAEEPKAPSAAQGASPVAAAIPPATPGETVPVAAAAPAAEPAAQAKFAEENFEVSIQPKGSYKKGQAGEAEIVLLAKGAFHVNDKYPYKFKLKEGGALKFPAPVVGKEQVKLEEKRATMLVGFTPDAPGKHVLAGQFLFSVCTDDKCLIEKRDLALEVTAD
jgi:pyruvate/2-oxoglutarate dehydrogenase complex dihydrolipoamide acyltransferase (E2) component